MSHLPDDERLARYLDLTERLKQGQFDVVDLITSAGNNGFDLLETALHDLAEALRRQAEEQRSIDQITNRINSGLLLDQAMNLLYDDFRDLIPYNRIGLALIEDDGQTVRARWNRSDRQTIRLRRNYAAPLAGSSLAAILQTNEPRILNDLRKYLRGKPESDSTRLIVEEGYRSSLTCPLIAQGQPVGFLFFSSIHADTYRDWHVALYQRIAAQVSIMVERGRLVSELNRQKRAVERQNDELRRLNDLKNTFLGIAAHDLRNPLGLVEMGITFLLDPQYAATAQEHTVIMRNILQQSRHMLDLINELLDVTAIESGQLQLKREKVALSDFLTETVQRHIELAAPKTTRICLESPLTRSDMIFADPLRLRQVLDNLISNAVKYSPPGSYVCVLAEHVEHAWRISVRDEGPGLKPEDYEHLFKDFAKLSARPTGGEKSTGLGLAISRRVVQAHGGQIGVDSSPGEGATFWFTIPDAAP
jgi:hypothetical protein